MNAVTLVRSFLIPSGLISLVVNIVLGAFVLLKNPRSPIHRFFAIFALTTACWSVGSSLENLIPDQTLALQTLRLCYLFAAFLPTCFLHFSLVLTQRDRPSTLLLRVAYGTSAILALLALTPLFIKGLHVISPYGFRISDPGPVYPVFFIFFAACLVGGLLMMYGTIRQATGHRRLQMQYIFAAFVIALGAGLEYFSRVFRLIRFPPLDDYILVLYFLLFAYAIVRHQLLDIQIVLRRSLVYSLLIACMTATYLVVVLVAERVFQGAVGYRAWPATVLVAFLIAIFFHPLRERIQALVDRALLTATPIELAAQREQLLVQLRQGEQQKAVATLAAGLAHEIKNPLTAIKTFVEFLPEQHTDPHFIEKFHRIVGEEVEKLQAITQNLLLFAKPEPSCLEPLEVSEMIESTLLLLKGHCGKQGIKVETRVASALMILGDRVRLKQAVLNLCLNSIEAMDSDGTLRIEVVDRNTHVELAVHDTGCGIPPEHLVEVCKPFFSTKASGTGLGLSVVQSIIEEHRGRLRIASVPGKGTHVTLELPTGK